MAKFALTSYLKLKKIKPGERDWANEECSNWEKIDKFAQWIASILNTISGGSLIIPPPVFNDVFNTLEIKGMLEPSSAVYSNEPLPPFDPSNPNEPKRYRVIEGIETFSSIGLTRVKQYAYLDDGRLDSITTDFDETIRVDKFVYDVITGELLAINVTETNNGSL